MGKTLASGFGVAAQPERRRGKGYADRLRSATSGLHWNSDLSRTSHELDVLILVESLDRVCLAPRN